MSCGRSDGAENIHLPSTAYRTLLIYREMWSPRRVSRIVIVGISSSGRFYGP